MRNNLRLKGSIPRNTYALISKAKLRHQSTMSTPDTATPLPHSSTTKPPPANPFVLERSANFKALEAVRPPFQPNLPVTTTQTPKPDWVYGSGSNDTTTAHLSHVELDPATSPLIQNYQLLISAIPRPISFVSTLSKDGKRNLAPFSYFQVVDHDPPIFVIGFSGRATRPKDTRRNLLETGECVISVVSEPMIEGVNATSLDVPYGVSEWEVAGFSGAKSATVIPERVKEAVFSVEGKLLEMKEMSYHGEKEEGKQTGALAIVEGTRFWVREDALSDDRREVKLEKMRPLVQLGGISYSRVRETFELPRGRTEEEIQKGELGLAKILENVEMNR